MDCYIARRQKGYPLFTIVSDAFNRSNGNLGNADSGQPWLTGGAATTAWVVSSNVAKRATATNSYNDVAYIDVGKTDVTISADVVMTNTYGTNLVARMSGTSFANSMSVYLDTFGQVAVQKTIGGLVTVLGLTTFSYTPGTVYSCVFSCKGNDFKVYINGALKVSVTDDNALKTNTKCGMLIGLFSTTTASDYIDNFLVKG